jgi:hypothetical protein
MATAAKLATLPAPAAPELSVAEEYALLTSEEIFAASQETSRVYNGHIIAKAILLVQFRIRCRNLSEMAKRLGAPKNVLYRYAKGLPLSDHRLRRALRDLACFLDEQRP